MQLPSQFGIDDFHYVEIDLDGETHPHRYPPEYVVIEPTSTVVGDDMGMRVASYPYDRYEAREDGSWQFYSEMGDYILRQGPPLSGE
jgi:hypothetical protein